MAASTRPSEPGHVYCRACFLMGRAMELIDNDVSNNCSDEDAVNRAFKWMRLARITDHETDCQYKSNMRPR